MGEDLSEAQWAEIDDEFEQKLAAKDTEITELKRELSEWRTGLRRSGISPICPVCSKPLLELLERK